MADRLSEPVCAYCETDAATESSLWPVVSAPGEGNLEGPALQPMRPWVHFDQSGTIVPLGLPTCTTPKLCGSVYSLALGRCLTSKAWNSINLSSSWFSTYWWSRASPAWPWSAVCSDGITKG